MIVTTITNSSGHQLAQVQVGATNYMETDSNIVMAATSHQRQVGAGQLTRSICRQHYNAQVTTPVAPAISHQIQANQNQWPTVVDSSGGGGGGGQWSSSHKFHMNQEQNCGQKPANEGSFYDYFQVKFSTPTTNHYLENSRLVAGTRTDEFNTQQHPYQATTNHHHHHHHHDPNHHYDHYYNPAAANQVQVSYNVANVYSSNLSYQPDAARDRYHQQISTYHDNQAYNETAPQSSTATSVTSSETCPPSTSLYHGQQNHQNFPSPIKAQVAATNRVSFGEMNSKCRPINIAEQTGAVWVSHTQYHDYGLTPLVGHNKEVDSVQIPDQAHNWPTKVAFAPVRAQPECQDLANGYDYYRPECRTDQTAFNINSADTTTTSATSACDHQIFQKVSSSPPSASNYHSNASKRSILATGNGLELKQVTANRSLMEEKLEPVPMFHEVSMIQSCKPVGAQLEKQSAKTIQFELKNKIPSGPAATSKNQPTHTDRLNQCRICGRHYARPSTLKTHLRTHTNERPYKCAVCRKTFSQAANLTAHQRVHTGERPFPCPICGRQFSQSSSVITHLRTHSGERPYRCNMCNRTFSDSSTLTKHCRIHSGEKPYQCDHCPMNFSQSGNLSRHLRLHSIGISSNKTHLATATTTTTTAVAANVAQSSNVVAVSAPPKTPTANQRNHSNNPSSSPDSTLSNYSIYSRVSSGVDNLTDAPRSGPCELANCK